MRSLRLLDLASRFRLLDLGSHLNENPAKMRSFCIFIYFAFAIFAFAFQKYAQYKGLFFFLFLRLLFDGQIVNFANKLKSYIICFLLLLIILIYIYIISVSVILSYFNVYFIYCIFNVSCFM